MPITWTGVLAIENDNDEPSTGDGRSISLGALRWETPIPLRWAPEDHGSHDGAMVVGTIDTITREDGGIIRGSGTFDDGSDIGLEAARHAATGLTVGLSIDPDDFTMRITPPNEPEPDNDGSVTVSASDQLQTLIDARIRSATMVAIPALVEAKIEMVEGFGEGDTDEEEDVQAEEEPDEDDESVTASATLLDFAAIKPHSTGVQSADTPWDASTMEKRTKTDQEPAYYTRIFAFQNPDTDGSAKFHYRFPHHHVSEAGAPGEANVRAARAIIGILNGARGGTTISDDDKKSVYNHVARHMEDGGVEPPAPKFALDDDVSFSYEADNSLARIAMKEALDEVFGPEPAFCGPCNLSASGAYVMDPVSKEFFTKEEFASLTPLSISDSGDISGHILGFNTCHTGIPNCTLAPRTNTDYAYFHVGATPLDDGTTIPTGVLTVGGGHADLKHGWRAAKAHYDDVTTAFADVVAWEDEHGIAVHGKVRDGLSDEILRQVFGAAPSGDWRRIGNNLELVGAHMVNQPGYPVARVASGFQQALIASSEAPVSTPVTAQETADAEAVAQRILHILDMRDEALALRAEVGPFTEDHFDALNRQVHSTP